MTSMLPVGLLVTLVSAVIVAAVLGLRALLRRVIPRPDASQADEAVKFLVGGVASFYGLIAGFMLSGAAVRADTVRAIVTAELNVLVNIERIGRLLDSAVGQELRDGVRHYLIVVIDQELQLMAVGESSPAATVALERLWQAAMKPEQADELDATLRNMVLDRLTELGEQRRLRIVASRYQRPTVVWVILIGGAITLVAGASIMSLRRVSVAGDAFLLAYTVLVALVVLGTHVLDQPFRFALDREIESYSLVLHSLGMTDSAGP